MTDLLPFLIAQKITLENYNQPKYNKIYIYIYGPKNFIVWWFTDVESSMEHIPTRCTLKLYRVNKCTYFSNYNDATAPSFILLEIITSLLGVGISETVILIISFLS